MTISVISDEQTVPTNTRRYIGSLYDFLVLLNTNYDSVIPSKVRFFHSKLISR